MLYFVFLGVLIFSAYLTLYFVFLSNLFDLVYYLGRVLFEDSCNKVRTYYVTFQTHCFHFVIMTWCLLLGRYGTVHPYGTTLDSTHENVKMQVSLCTIPYNEPNKVCPVWKGHLRHSIHMQTFLHQANRPASMKQNKRIKASGRCLSLKY